MWVRGAFWGGGGGGEALFVHVHFCIFVFILVELSAIILTFDAVIESFLSIDDFRPHLSASRLFCSSLIKAHYGKH